MKRTAVFFACLVASATSFAAPNKIDSEEFDPASNVEDFVQACRVSAKLDTKLKMTTEEQGAALMCISTVLGSASMFSGADKWTLSDGQTEISICPTGKVLYKQIAAKVVSLWDAGTWDKQAIAHITPGQMALVATHDLQPCPES